MIGKVIQHAFLAGSQDLEDRAVAVRTPVCGRAVQRTVDIEEGGLRDCAVMAIAEAVEYGFRPGWRDRKSDPVTGFRRVVAPSTGRAVELAFAVDEAGFRVLPVGLPAFETVEYGFVTRRCDEKTVPQAT